MKILMIGGTGTISTAITRQLSETKHEVYLLNRGTRNAEVPANINVINVDINNEAEVLKKLDGMNFDAVCEFIGFVTDQVERDYRLFNGRTKQYIYISSASAYHKPVGDYRITEGTALANPYWEYSRNKIACEEYLMKMYRENGFPVTIVRPSHTYDLRALPLGVHGDKGGYQVVKRMLEGKPVIIPGDGTSLWTITSNEDFAKAYIGLIGNPHAIGEAYQITSDESVTWTQIHKIVADVLGVEFKPYFVASEFLAAVSDYDFTGSLIGDKSNTVVFDNTKIKNAVPGFVATISAREGLTKTVEYIMAHEECQVEDPEFDAWCDKVIEKLEAVKKEF